MAREMISRKQEENRLQARVGKPVSGQTPRFTGNRFPAFHYFGFILDFGFWILKRIGGRSVNREFVHLQGRCASENRSAGQVSAAAGESSAAAWACPHDGALAPHGRFMPWRRERAVTPYAP